MLANNYVEDLGLNYRYHVNRKVLEFEDGVEYTLAEAMILSKGHAKGHDLRMIHETKKTFDGFLITKNEEQNIDWREYESSASNARPSVTSERCGGETKKDQSEKTANPGIDAKRKTPARKQKYRDPQQTSLWLQQEV
jgi:hypothetical protein